MKANSETVKARVERAASGDDLINIAEDLFDRGLQLSHEESELFLRKFRDFEQQLTWDDCGLICDIAQDNSELENEAYKRSLEGA